MSLFQRIKTPFTDRGSDDTPPSMPRARPIGDILRERREELDLDLDQIGEILRIKPAYLAALEQGRPQDLPGPTYVIGFVRAYARHLGLDDDRVLEHYKAQSAEVHARPDLALPVPLGARSVPGGPVLLVALILAICGYGTWYYLSTGDRSRPERVAVVPAELQMPQGIGQPDAPPSPAGPVGAANAGAAANARLSSGLFAAPGTASDTAAAPEPVALTPPVPASPGPIGAAPAQPAAAPPSPASPTPGAKAGTAAAKPDTVQTAAQPPAEPAAPADGTASPVGRIDIRALADCWIQVRASDQSIVFSRVLKAGETYHVPARPGLFLRTGNAGGLAIAVDGKPTPPIGGNGVLRRNVVLDPEALLGGTAVQG